MNDDIWRSQLLFLLPTKKSVDCSPGSSLTNLQNTWAYQLSEIPDQVDGHEAKTPDVIVH